MDGGAFCCVLSMLGLIAGFVVWILRSDQRSARESELEGTVFSLSQRVATLEASLRSVELKLVQWSNPVATSGNPVATSNDVGAAAGAYELEPGLYPSNVAMPGPSAASDAEHGTEQRIVSSDANAQTSGAGQFDATPESGDRAAAIPTPQDSFPIYQQAPSSYWSHAAEPNDMRADEVAARTDAQPETPAAPVFTAEDAGMQPDAQPSPGDPQAQRAVDNPFEAGWQRQPMPEESNFNWEEWLGVKGAAAVGSMVLVVAAFYLFRYGVEHDWFNFTPAFRVSAALLFGVACVASSVPLRRRDQAILGDWLTGAGIAILYASIWAGRALYQLFDTGVAGVGLAAVTLTCGVLATRRDAIVIAGLGLIGGFITPLLLSTGVDRPISLFSYLFLLCLGVAFVARRKARENPAWNVLMVAALAFLGSYQLGWLVLNMDAHEVVIGSVVTFAFATLFVGYGAELKKHRPDSVSATLLLVGSIALLILSTFVFAVHASVVVDVWPTAILVLPMLVLVEWIANREEVPYYSLPATLVAVVALTTALLCRAPATTPMAMALALAPLFGVFLISHATHEWQTRTRGTLSRISGLGIYMVPVAFWILLSAHRVEAPAFFASMFAMILFALRASFLFAANEEIDDESDPSWVLGSHVFVRTMVSAVFAFVFTLLASGMLPGHRLAWFSLATVLPFAFASLLPTLRPTLTRVAIWLTGAWMLFAPMVLQNNLESVLWLVSLLGIGLALAYRARSGVSVALLGSVFSIMWSSLAQHHDWSAVTPIGKVLPFVLVLSGTLFFYLMPSLFLRRVLSRSDHESWNSHPNMLLNGVVVALVILIGNVLSSYNFVWGRRGMGLVAVALALPALLVYWGERSAFSDFWRRGLATRFIGLALCLVVTAVPLELRKQWITVGWALQGAALVWLFTRIESRGPLWLAGALFAFVTMRLVLNPYVFQYQARGLPILNWLMYTYLVPAAAMGFAAQRLHRVLAQDSNELGDGSQEAIGTLRNLLVGAMFLLGFVWVNLTIFDAFGTERFLSIALERHAIRDVVLSVAWGLYAIMLLALGIWQRQGALRWASLALMYLSIFKMFLYDLGNLAGLFRVLSLLGLAASFIVVALVYKSYLFPNRQKSMDGGAR